MAVATSPTQALRQQSVQLRVRFEVQKDDASWLDLSDRTTHDRLRAMSGLQRRQEAMLGRRDVPSMSLTVDNADRYWDGAMPTGLTSWYRRPVRLSVLTSAGVTAVGVFLVDDLSTSTHVDTATLSLVGLGKRLVDKQADRVKHGQGWYANRPISWLVQQLLQQEFTKAEVDAWRAAGLLLGRYKIPLSASTVSADGSNRALSHFGRPPEWDGTAWRDEGTALYGAPLLCVTDTNNLKGTATSWYGRTLVGIGATLWWWDADTDTWTTIGAVAGNRKIQHIWWDQKDHLYVGVAWEPEIPSTDTAGSGAAGNRSGYVSGTVQFFRSNPTTGAFETFVPSGITAGQVIWTGHYGVRAGGHDTANKRTGAGGDSIAGAQSSSFGPNCPVAQTHWMRTRSAIGGVTTSRGQRWPYWNKASGALTSYYDDNGGVSAPFWGQEYGLSWESFTIGESGVDVDRRPLDYRFNFGQFAGAFAMQNAGAGSTDGQWLAFFTIRWDGASNTYKYALYKMDVGATTPTATSLAYDLLLTPSSVPAGAAATQPAQPICLGFSADDRTLYVGSAIYVETDAGGLSLWTGAGCPDNSLIGCISKHPWSAPTSPTLVFDSSNATGTGWATSDFRNGLLPLQIVCTQAGSDWLAVSWLDYKSLLSNTPGYWFSVLDLAKGGGPAGYWGTTRFSSSGRFTGLIGDYARSRMYIHDGGANRVLSFTTNNYNATILTEDAGLTAVDGEPGLFAGLVYDLKRDALYGISGPGPGATADASLMDSAQTGLYYLWQFASTLTDRIDLADFSEKMVADALDALAAVGDFVWDFDTTGRAFFLPRPASPTIIDTLKARGLILDVATATMGTALPVERFSKKPGYGEVANVCELVPSRAVLQQPKAQARPLVRPPSFKRDLPGGNAAVSQTNTKAQTISLRCVQGGTPGSEDDGVIGSTKAGTAVSDTASPYHKLRFAWLLTDAVVETQLLAGTSTVSTTIQVPSSAAKDIRAGAAGYGDLIRIADVTQRTVIASDYATVGLASGITTLTLDIAVGATYATGTRLTVRTAATTRWSDGPTGVTTLNGSINTVVTGLLLTSTADVALYSVIRVDGEDMRVTAKDADGVTITVARHVGGTAVATHASGASVKCFWAPIVTATYPANTVFAIGGTGVSLKIDVPAATGTTREMPWMLGDEIEIVCPGLTLESQEQAKVVAMNQASITKYGRLPFQPGRQSPFLSYRQATEVARRIVTALALPRYLLTAEGKCVTLPVLGDTYLVEDPAILPWSSSSNPNGNAVPVSPDTARAIACSVRGFTIDPLADRLTLDLRAINPNTR